MKRFFAGLLGLFFCVSISASAASLDTVEPIIEDVNTTVSEYDLAVQKSEEYSKSPQLFMDTKSIDPLVEYETAFSARAELPVETLQNFGYSEEEIQLMKEYADGDLTFEQVAPLASAYLSTELTCGTHTTSRYIVRYYWVWDKTPVGLGEDGFGLALYGIKSNSTSFDTKLNSYSAKVNYYYTYNTSYKSVTPTVDVSNNYVSAKFASYKQDDLGSSWVWAKSGYFVVTITPVITNGTQFAAVRALGEYGHTSKDKSKLNVAVSVNPAAQSLSISFSIKSGGGSVTKYGKRQSIFYNDGSVFPEYPK